MAHQNELLAKGISLVHEAVTLERKAAAADIEQLEGSVTGLNREVAVLREEVARLRRDATQLRESVQEKDMVINQLTAERNTWENKYTTLHGEALELERFKRNISSMVSTGGASSLLAASPSREPTTAAGQQPRASASAAISPVQPITGVHWAMTSPPGVAPHSSASVSHSRAPAAAAAAPPAFDSSLFRTPAKSPSVSPPRKSPAAASPSLLPVDAKQLYRQVKDVLLPEEFANFSAVIRAMNERQNSPDETLARVKVIFGENRPFLFGQMRQLVMQAQKEAYRQDALDAANAISGLQEDDDDDEAVLH